jgi:hypothetical protein
MNNEPLHSDDQPEELVRTDDVIIGKAVRWSAIAALAIAVIACCVIFIFKRKPAPSPPRVTQLSAPVVPARSEAEVPAVKFTDITREAGITFVHNTGAYGDKLLPESMGGGCAFLDFDNDGHQDILFVNSTYWPWKIPNDRKPTTAALYRNEGNGKFTDVTAGSGLDISLYGMGVAVGDYDNDGNVDIYITCVGENHLFHNLGNGKFKDATAEAGVAGSNKEWSTAAAWVDIDNDGDLDLFVANYVRWSKEIDLEVGYKLVGLGRAYGPPMNFEGTFPCLYRNDGNGKFTDISAISGVQIKNPSTGVPAAKSLGVAPIDLNGDGWMDLIVANDTVQNYVFSNQCNGTFKEIGAITGVAFDNYGNTRGAMGIDAARFRNDQSLGIGIGNFANEMTAVYVSSPNNAMFFTDEAISEGIGPVSRLPLKFGVFFFDYDLDGWLDLLTANGHLEEEINKVQQSQQYRQSAQLFWNSGGSKSSGGFLPAPVEKCGPDLFKPIVGRGSAFADIDNDGDLDLLLTQIGGPPILLRNDQKLDHRWLRLKLVGTKSNRDAIGAWVKVRIGDKILARQVMPTRSYLSQSELPITIGLGQGSSHDGVEIVWPGGQTQKVDGVRLNSLAIIEQSR